jgi:hypothetical protein
VTSRSYVLALLAAALLGAAGRAHADPLGATDFWYGYARAGIVATDQSFSNDGRIGVVGVGRTFGPTYALEVEATADQIDFGIDYGLRHKSLEANWITINPEPLWHPYFLIGLGVIDFDAPEGLAHTHGTNALFNLGVGGMWELVIPNRVFFRADLRLRYDLNETHQPGQDGFGDGILSLGLMVPFR